MTTNKYAMLHGYRTFWFDGAHDNEPITMYHIVNHLRTEAALRLALWGYEEDHQKRWARVFQWAEDRRVTMLITMMERGKAEREQHEEGQRAAS